MKQISAVAKQSVVGHKANYNRTCFWIVKQMLWHDRVWSDTKLPKTEQRICEADADQCRGIAECGWTQSYLQQNMFLNCETDAVAWQSVGGHEATYTRTAIMWSRSVPWQSRVWLDRLDTKLPTTERVFKAWNRCCGMTECGRECEADQCRGKAACGWTQSYLQQNMFLNYETDAVAWQSVGGHEATYSRTAIMWSRSCFQGRPELRIAVYLVISLPKIPYRYTQCIQTVLTNPTCFESILLVLKQQVWKGAFTLPFPLFILYELRYIPYEPRYTLYAPLYPLFVTSYGTSFMSHDIFFMRHCILYSLWVGLARTVYIRIYTPYIWWFPSQKYRMYTVYTCKCMVLANPTYELHTVYLPNNPCVHENKTGLRYCIAFYVRCLKSYAQQRDLRACPLWFVCGGLTIYGPRSLCGGIVFMWRHYFAACVVQLPIRPRLAAARVLIADKPHPKILFVH